MIAYIIDWFRNALITLTNPSRSGVGDRGVLVEVQPTSDAQSTGYSLQSDELQSLEYEIEGIRMQLDDDRSVTNLRACELINDLNALTRQRHILVEAQHRHIQSDFTCSN